MDAVLNCKPEDLEDYYGLLGCDELSSVSLNQQRPVDASAKDVRGPIRASSIQVVAAAFVFNNPFLSTTQTEQILNEYKIRALTCHPDKHLDNPGAVADFQKLQEAKEVLCNETKRKNYDLWKRSGVTIPFHDWQALNDSVKTSMHWAVRNKKEPMLEASKAEIPVTSQTEDPHAAKESPEIPSHDAMPSSSDYCHRRFRFAADSPSTLLQRFRNYEI